MQIVLHSDVNTTTILLASKLLFIMVDDLFYDEKIFREVVFCIALYDENILRKPPERLQLEQMQVVIHLRPIMKAINYKSKTDKNGQTYNYGK